MFNFFALAKIDTRNGSELTNHFDFVKGSGTVMIRVNKLVEDFLGKSTEHGFILLHLSHHIIVNFKVILAKNRVSLRFFGASLLLNFVQNGLTKSIFASSVVSFGENTVLLNITKVKVLLEKTIVISLKIGHMGWMVHFLTQA